MLRASVRANLIQPSVFTIFVFRNTMKMKPLFICYPRCSTCQKALKWLQERGIEVEVRDIVQQNPSEAELEEWIDRSGLAVNRFFNTSGLRYKALNLKEKGPHGFTRRADPRAFDRRYVGETAFADRFRQDFGRIPRAGVGRSLVGKKIGVSGCTEIGSGRKFSVRRGYFFILSGCRSRLILFLRRTDQPK